MKTIQEYLTQKQANFVQHPFFNQISNSNNLQDLIYISKRLSFWSMSFQDLLRLNEMQIDDTKLRHIAQHQRREDAGHDKWFLNDLQEISNEQPNLESLYSEEHAYTRHTTYILMSEVFRARNDYERIALLLTIESAAQVFFEYSADFTERIGYSHLKYFSHNHLEAEKNHELYEHEMDAYLETIQLNQNTKKNILDLIDRAYDAFMLMLDGLTVEQIPSRSLLLKV